MELIKFIEEILPTIALLFSIIVLLITLKRCRW